MTDPEGGGASRTTEAAAGSSAPTDVSLREYVTLMVNALESRMLVRMSAADKAIEKAEQAIERRLEGQNEWRAQSSDRERTQAEAINRLTSQLLPREVFETTLQQWSEWRTAVDNDRARISGRGDGVQASFGMIFAVGAFIATVIGIVVVIANVMTN